jgi:hypothetical protein
MSFEILVLKYVTLKRKLKLIIQANLNFNRYICILGLKKH